MKGFYKHVFMIFTLIVCLFFLTSPSQSYYSAPPPYPYYQQPVNINISLGGFPGSYSSGFPSWTCPNYLGGIYGPYGPYPYVPTSSSGEADDDKFAFSYSNSDGEYIYVAFSENGGKDRGAIAILGASGSDDYEYLSHLSLGNVFYATAANKIIVQDNLLVIGAMTEGRVYLVDITDKEEPEILNKLDVGEDYQSDGGGVKGLVIEDNVLFVCVEFPRNSPTKYANKYVIFALDISNPEDTDEDDDQLDDYVLDDDYQEIYTMVSTPDYLYIAGQYEGEPTISVMDISDPEHLSLVETIGMGGDGDLSIALNGNYLAAAVEVSGGNTKLKMVDITNPESLDIVSSSDKFSGRRIFGYDNIVIHDDYAYVARDIDSDETKIYVFDIEDPDNPDLVDESKAIEGTGLNLYLVSNNRLCLHTDEMMQIFDISNPENISKDETVDILDILEDELDDWGDEDDRSSSSYSSGGYPPYGLLGFTGWGGPTYGSYPYGSYSSYGSSGYTPPSPWTPQYLGTGYGSGIPLNAAAYYQTTGGYGGPTYGGFGSRYYSDSASSMLRNYGIDPYNPYPPYWNQPYSYRW